MNHNQIGPTSVPCGLRVSYPLGFPCRACGSPAELHSAYCAGCGREIEQIEQHRAVRVAALSASSTGRRASVYRRAA